MVSADKVSTTDNRERFSEEMQALREDRAARWQEYLALAREEGATGGAAADLRQVVDFLDWRITRLTEALASAPADDAARPAPGVVGLGSRVRVRWPDGEEELFTVVSELESDPGQGRLSCEAPLGQALLGSRVGDTVESQAPDGPLRLCVLSVA